MKPDKPTYFLCAPADTRWVARGSTFDRTCSRCNRQVAVAPSGQKFLRDREAEQVVRKLPALPILCAGCYFLGAQSGDEFIPAAGSWEEVLREFAQSVPNMRRFRN